MTTIKLKNGSGAPLAGDLVVAEPALDLTNKRLYTEDSGGTVIEVGTNPGTDVTFADNRKAIFGAGSDLQIYHDGVASRIVDSGTGNLTLRGEDLYLQNADGSKTYANFGATNGDTALWYNNLIKFKTTSTGIDVTGTAVTDGVTVAGNLSVDGGTIKLDGNYPTGTDNVALGNTALDSLVSGNYSTAIGANALTASTASSNTGIGFAALEANTSGTQNTAVGMQALTDNTTANNNVAVGHRTLYSNTTGASNLAIGVEALNANTTASNNTAVGYQAFYSNQTAGNNSAYGYQAGFSNTAGGAFTAIGYLAGYSNTTGNYNTALGSNALQDNTTGASNTALGQAALENNTTASNNTAVGYAALDANTTGARNTALGDNALGAVTTGDNNLGAGRSAGLALTTGVNNTFVGAYNGSTGGSGELITTGSKNTILGSYNGNQGGLDIRTSSNNIVLSDGDGNPRLYLDSLGRPFCVGAYSYTTAAAANMFVSSTGQFFRSTSSSRYKNTIQDATHGLTELLTLRPVTYKGNDDGDTVFGGLIAEEVHDSGLTEFVEYNQDGDPDSLAYANMVSLCIKAIQELKSELDAATARIATLESN